MEGLQGRRSEKRGSEWSGGKSWEDRGCPTKSKVQSMMRQIVPCRGCCRGLLGGTEFCCHTALRLAGEWLSFLAPALGDLHGVLFY